MTPKEALEILYNARKYSQSKMSYDAITTAIEALEGTEPTAQLMPIVEENGRPYWEENYEPMFICSRCECKTYKKPFCPHCGARITEAKK